MHDGSGYSYTIEAYGDLSAAIEPQMALQFYVGDQSVFVMSGLWTQTSRGWRAPRDH